MFYRAHKLVGYEVCYCTSSREALKGDKVKKVLIMLMVSAISAFAVCDPINDPESCIGPQGIPGLDGANAGAYESLEAGLAAMGGLELNPTHTGFSLALGVSQTSINHRGGAIGMMYVFDLSESKGFKTGLNIKAYKAQGGANGFAGGLTLSY